MWHQRQDVEDGKSCGVGIGIGAEVGVKRKIGKGGKGKEGKVKGAKLKRPRIGIVKSEQAIFTGKRCITQTTTSTTMANTPGAFQMQAVNQQQQMPVKRVKLEPKNIKLEPKNVKLESKNVNLEPSNIKTIPKNIKAEPKNIKVETCSVKLEPKLVSLQPLHLQPNVMQTTITKPKSLTTSIPQINPRISIQSPKQKSPYILQLPSTPLPSPAFGVIPGSPVTSDRGSDLSETSLDSLSFLDNINNGVYDASPIITPDFSKDDVLLSPDVLAQCSSPGCTSINPLDKSFNDFELESLRSFYAKEEEVS